MTGTNGQALVREFFHMSASSLNIGDQVHGNGRDKVDPRIETELQKRKPAEMMSRRDAVFARPVADFSKCGIVNAGYIYSVTLDDKPQCHDLNWIGMMQMALLKEKYIDRYPGKFSKYPDWSDELIERCCAGYWSGEPSDSPVWETLASSLTVAASLSDRVVNVSETRGGWSQSKI